MAMPPIKQALSVGEVAKRSGVTVSTLHFYESKGLIRSWRNTGNQRRYPRSVLRRVALIKVAQRTGIPLAEIKQALQALPEQQPSTHADWQKLATQWHDSLTNRIHQLTQLRDQLTGCIGCGCLSMHNCPLRNPADVLAQEGAGAHFLEPGEQKS